MRKLDTRVEPISYVYSVDIPNEGEWQVKIGEDTHSLDAPVEEVFELVSWDNQGDLTEILQRFD